jgi:hypothetical protein
VVWCSKIERANSARENMSQHRTFQKREKEPGLNTLALYHFARLGTAKRLGLEWHGWVVSRVL